MFSWFAALMPREEKFFDYFEQHARILVESSGVLRELFRPGADIAACAARINKLEGDADEVTHEVMLAVRRTFITPFDRSDIQDLIMSMDDAIDQMKQTAKAILLFEVTEFEGPMRLITEKIVSASEITCELILALREMKKKSSQMMAMSAKITQLEEAVDDLHDNGLKQLYLAHRNDKTMVYIVGAEIYGHLEKILDRIEDVGERVNSIVVEHL
ncbi:MAG: P-Phosphate transport regulator [Rhodospirillales bacterium]|jgi:predicted phosphate transport protein (TIGR00153 family)|nr:P-Phosphate transport regulator [Rhodospirillales bacterium]